MIKPFLLALLVAFVLAVLTQGNPPVDTYGLILAFGLIRLMRVGRSDRVLYRQIRRHR